MTGHRIIETMGSITKVEKLETLNNNILENTLVLDEVEPFPGYHGTNLPTGYNPNTVYLILKKEMSTVSIFRLNHLVRKYFKQSFDGTVASVCISNYILHCIRIRNLKNYSIIPDLQKSYISEGITFMKKKKISGEGIIEIKKHFELEELEDGIFKDAEDPLMFYIRIPLQINWHLFQEINSSVRHNIDRLNYDAALGVIYLKEICDIIRIFARDMTLDELRTIKSMYAEELKKY